MASDEQITGQLKSNENMDVYSKYHPLTGPWYWVTTIFPGIVIVLALIRVFDLRFLVGFMINDMTYYYLVIALLLSLGFIHFPPKAGLAGRTARWTLWIDRGIFFFIIGSCFYFSWVGLDVITKGWGAAAPFHATIMGTAIWFLIIESVRRSAGLALTTVVLVFSLYPLYAKHMPGILYGFSMSFLETAQYHIFGKDSALGVLMAVYADIILGFILFGVAVIATRGGEFMLDLSLSLVGGARGGIAKVATVASAMFGSVSGSSSINVITTGSVTIPAMKKMGFLPYFAGAVEATASTAGPLMPPIMGAAAFIMATFVSLPYPTIAISAAVPAILFYIGILIQIDGYAAQHELKGLPKNELPSPWATLKRGWYFIPTVAVLIYALFVMRLVSNAPYIATGVMLALAQIHKDTRFSRKSFLKFLEDCGQNFFQILVIVIGIGLVVGAIGVTGLASSFSRELLMVAGDNPALILIFGALAGFVLGMGMTITGAYIFLAVVVAPALTKAGFDVLASHFFVMYVAMLSHITPPVAICAFVASSIAKATPMKIAFTACRLGAVVFFIPFFFVIEPALLLRGAPLVMMRTILTAVVGIFIMGSAFQGYFIGIGNLWPPGRTKTFYAGSILLRFVLAASGFMIALPIWQVALPGLIIAGVILIPMYGISWRAGLRGRKSDRLDGA